MKIDLYTCKFGNGHMGAAKHIQNILLPYAKVHILDIVEEIFPKTSPLIYRLYARTMKSKGLFYHTYIQVDKEKETLVPKLKHLEEKIFASLDQNPLPDVWIASYSMAAYFLSEYKKKRKLEIPLVTCLTDFTPHRFWINEACDLYLVPSPFTKTCLMKESIPEEKIILFGLDQETIKKEKQGQDIHILVTGGGLGLLPKNLDFYRKLRRRYSGEIRVVCGKNKELYQRLQKANIPGVKVLGFVEDMNKELAWADFMVGKAGGLSTLEAIEAETPILYLKPFLPQEKRNATFIMESKIGFPLEEESYRLTNKKDSKVLFEYQKNMQHLKGMMEKDALIGWLGGLPC